MTDQGTYGRALAFTLQWEGEYVNHPKDPGGATNKGITQAVYNSYRRAKGKRTRSVRWIRKSEVHDIYRTRYWDAARCDGMPHLVAIAHFDWAVNTGLRRATRHLQGVVGTATDGVWGPKSQKALLDRVAERGELIVTEQYMNRRERYYLWLGSTPRFKVFLRGWMNRLNALRRLIRKEAPCA